MTGIHRLSAADVQPAVGRDVEAWCAKCAQALEHVIVAMVGLQIVQVRCRECSGVHKFKSTKEAAAPATVRKPKAAKSDTPAERSKPMMVTAPRPDPPDVRAAKVLWQRRIAAHDRAKAIAYTAAWVAHAGQLVDHKSFGYGIVEKVMDGKAQLLFEAGYKILVTGK